MAKVLGVLVAALPLWSLVATDALAEGRWQQVENQANCTVWNANPHPNETVTWTGACVNGKAEGRGREVRRNLKDGEWKESSYTGMMRDGKRHGRGVYVWANGDRYEGAYRDGKKHGRGIWVGANGDRYEGDWKDGKWRARGGLVSPNANECEGDLREVRPSESGEVWGNGKFKKCHITM
jgi:hypothetical protein